MCILLSCGYIFQELSYWQRTTNIHNFDIHHLPCYDITINIYISPVMFIHTTHL